MTDEKPRRVSSSSLQPGVSTNGTFSPIVVVGREDSVIGIAGSASEGIVGQGVWGATEQLWNAYHNCTVAPQPQVAASYRTVAYGLTKATASKKSLAGKPGGVFRGQKDSDGGDITWLADAAERGLREGELFELRSDEAAAVGAFSLDYAGTEGVDPDLFRAELAGQHDGDGVDRGLSAGVNRAVRRCDATGNGAHVYDAASLSEVLHSGLRNKEEAQHIDVEVPVKVLLGDGLEGGVLVGFAGVAVGAGEVVVGRARCDGSRTALYRAARRDDSPDLVEGLVPLFSSVPSASK